MADGPLEVATSLVEFGAVPIGETSTMRVSLRNLGDEPVDFLEVVPASGLDPDFEIGWFDDVFTLEPGGAGASITIDFRPIRIESYAGSFVIWAEGLPDRPVDLSGTGVQAIRLDTSEIDFGGTLLGESKVRSIELSNISTIMRQVTYTAVSFVSRCVDDPVAPYCVRSSPMNFDVNGRVLVPAGDSLTIEVEFSTPLGLDNWAGEFTLAAGPPLTVQLSGLSTDFAFVCSGNGRLEATVGSCDIERFDCTNLVEGTVAVEGWRLAEREGDFVPSPPFSIDTSRRESLSEGEFVSFNVEFCPVRTGAILARVLVDSSEREVEVLISGLGL
ncbi:MAG: hypothetical protein AAGH15_16190 [Myxococcota bacterium]